MEAVLGLIVLCVPLLVASSFCYYIWGSTPPWCEIKYDERFEMRVPRADLHAVIHGFLRTSAHGSWTVCGNQHNDVFVLNYSRGSTKRIINPSTLERMPLSLRVTMRPLAAEAVVSLRFTGSIYVTNQPKDRYHSAMHGRISNEVNDLAAYIAEYHGLPEPPIIERGQRAQWPNQRSSANAA